MQTIHDTIRPVVEAGNAASPVLSTHRGAVWILWTVLMVAIVGECCVNRPVMRFGEGWPASIRLDPGQKHQACLHA